MNKNKNKLDEFYYHEAIDRLYFIQTMIDEMLVDHPVVKNDKQSSELIDEAMKKLIKAYNFIASKRANLFLDKVKEK